MPKHSSGKIPSLTLIETDISTSHALIPLISVQALVPQHQPTVPGHVLVTLIPEMCIFMFRGGRRGLISIWLDYACRPGLAVSWARVDAGTAVYVTWLGGHEQGTLVGSPRASFTALLPRECHECMA